ncbi:MAG: BBE domain-containing protein, partial [Thermomicrobiaceae bacterium]|nr:BBE domain-containing protein [Thermomicrobiaceae bacterium]
LLHASEQENADLFWGVRGAGANFGVVTSFEYRLHPIGPIVTGGLALFPAERALEVLVAFRALMADAPDELMIFAVALTAPPAPFVPEWLRGRPAAALGVCHCGSLAEGERAVAPIRALGPAADLIGPMPYVALQRLIDEAVPFGLHYYEKAAYLGRLDDEAIELWADQMAGMTSPLSMGILFALGGAVARLPEDAMAMGNRDSAYGYTAVSAWDGAEGLEAAARHIAWPREVSAAMEPYATGRTYVNFLGHGDEDRVRAAYNPATYERLVALKRRYDPKNVFRLNANIRP